MKHLFIIILILFISSTRKINGQNKKNALIERFDAYQKKCKEAIARKELDTTAIYIKKTDSLLFYFKDSSYYYKNELQKGTLLTAKGKYDIAMQKLFKATRFFKIQQDSSNYYYGKYKIGICYYYINRREEVKEIMIEIIKNSKFVTPQMISNAHSNIGAINIELGMLNNKEELIKNSIPNLRKAMNYNQNTKNYSKLSSNYSLLAEAHNQLKNKTKALKLLDTAIYYATKAKDISAEGFALIKKANILTVKKEYTKALAYINKATEIYRNSENIPTLIYSLGEKKKLLVAMKKYQQANIVSDSIYGFSIRYYDKRFVDGISKMEVKYKTAEKEREILEQKAILAQKELLIQKRNFQIYGMLGAILLLGLIGYQIYNQQRLKNKQLLKETELKNALQKIETQNKLQEQRLRISRDLHDNIGAQLSFIISSIDNLQYTSKDATKKFKDRLTYISNFTSTTIDQLRDTIWAMNKNEISIKDLESRILSFIEKAKQARLEVKIVFDNEINSKIYFTSIKGMNIFRVLQEALNNAVKYADATQINIALKEQKQQFKMIISDNGIGFNLKEVNLGNGLQNMQDRIAEINGQLDIKSQENNGTIITVICNKDKTDQV